MSEIRRVPQGLSGIPDAVELMTSCTVTRFREKEGVPVQMKGAPQLHPCKIMASYDNGTLSLSAREPSIMISVRLDEAMAVLKEAADANIEATGRKKEGAGVQADTASEG